MKTNPLAGVGLVRDNETMFLKCTSRRKNGKTHRYWSIVESERVRGGRVVQRQVLYLGEINDAQQAEWVRAIEIIERGEKKPRQVALFPADRPGVSDKESIHVQLNKLELHRPRQWGACWLACELWDLLRLDDFWGERLGRSREGTRWLNVLKLLVVYRLIAPGSEWRLHRQWYQESAMGDLLGEDFGLAESHKLYRCLDLLQPHKDELFVFLKERWGELFKPTFDVLLYDLTSTYFECDAPKEGKRRFGYSRDKRSDCLQVVIALVVTPEGFPLGYEVLPGNTSDKMTLRDFLSTIEQRYGKLNRVWVMDRGVPTEDMLAEMRRDSVLYLVGTPRGRLSKLEQAFLDLPWSEARHAVTVKLLPTDNEVYVLARSTDRVSKERSMRRRQLKRYWKRLAELRRMTLSRDKLLLKFGVAEHEAGAAARFVDVVLPTPDEEVSATTWHYTLNKKRLKEARRREGTYLLRSNITGENPGVLWQRYIQLTEVEQAFKDLKNDLSIRPIFHQTDERIEAHIFVAFLAYCLHVTLRNRSRGHAPGLSSRAVIDKFASMQMVDVVIPTTDGRKVTMTRYTQPTKDVGLLLGCLDLVFPHQPPPKISPAGELLH